MVLGGGKWGPGKVGGWGLEGGSRGFQEGGSKGGGSLQDLNEYFDEYFCLNEY